MRLLRQFDISESARMELSVELFNALDIDNVAFGGFNLVYGPGLDLATGQPIGPSPTLRRLRGDAAGYDRNNAKVLGVGPLQARIGVRFHF